MCGLASRAGRAGGAASDRAGLPQCRPSLRGRPARWPCPCPAACRRRRRGSATAPLPALPTGQMGATAAAPRCQTTARSRRGRGSALTSARPAAAATGGRTSARRPLPACRACPPPPPRPAASQGGGRRGLLCAAAQHAGACCAAKPPSPPKCCLLLTALPALLLNPSLCPPAPRPSCLQRQPGSSAVVPASAVGAAERHAGPAHGERHGGPRSPLGERPDAARAFHAAKRRLRRRPRPNGLRGPPLVAAVAGREPALGGRLHPAVGSG